MTKKCSACSSNPWKCRGCGAECCEHRCSLKAEDGTASCAKCQHTATAEVDDGEGDWDGSNHPARYGAS